ncbi:hypothetical protein L2E82_32110 [Cichorium intybus]|uniref:Uncharacterized protein n=1 Tax=Cichorium intybus TaxID=13427 RepID=A0ACB9BH40_CICIN|nr:hypothetical protein L2E82_32110 [Cichorium intybus]
MTNVPVGKLLRSKEENVTRPVPSKVRLWRLSNSMFLGSTRVNLYLFMTHSPYPLTKTPSPYKYVIPTASSLQTILSFPKIYNSIVS